VPGDAPLDPNSRLRRDIARQVRGAFLLAAVGLTLGVFLMPHGDELLLIHVRSRDLAGARRALAARDARGVSTVSSVVAHSELFLLEGRVDEALVDLESFVAAHRENAAAWRRLARLYQHAQRFDDQLRALAEVYRLEPSPDLARRLVTLYRWAGNESLEAARLRDLVRHDHADAAETLRSARLDAALGQPAAALATLERLAAREPDAFEYPDLELFASLLVDAGRTDTLSARVQALPLVRDDPALLSQLAVTMRRWGWITPAVRLFDTVHGHVPLPALLAGRARAAAGSALARGVLRDLMQIDAARPLADEPREEGVKLALSLRDEPAADALLSRAARPNPEVVALAISDAVARGARPRAQWLISRFGDAGLAADSPLLALELAAERGDRARAAAWIERMDASGVSDPLDVAAIAQVEARLGREAQAFGRLATLVRTGDAPGWAATDLTLLATRLSRVADALTALAPDAAAPIEPERRRAWAQLAAEHHRVDLLTAWMRNSTLTPADAPALRDVYYALSTARELDAAVTTAERLVALRASADDAVLLAQAFIADGRPRDALAPLRAAGLRTGEARAAYDSALARVLIGPDGTADLRAEALRLLRAPREAQGLEGRRALVEALLAAGERASLVNDVLQLAATDLDTWLSALVESAQAGGRMHHAAALIAGADGGLAALDERRRTDRVRALLELDASDGVLLPELRRLAFEQGNGWISVYDDHLGRAERSGEQIALWTTFGLAPESPSALRRAAAARLVEVGKPLAAADVYEALGVNAGPGDGDVKQLLSLWGSTKNQHRIDWLMSRLLSSPQSDRAEWMRHLVNAQGSNRIAAAFPHLPTDPTPDFVDAWLGAMRAAGDRAALSRAIGQITARTDTRTETLREAGRAALAENLPALVVQAFRLVAEREPNDREAVRWLGTLSFYDRRIDEARRYLTAYEALGGEEAEPLYQLAELTREEGRATEARRLYERALVRLSEPVTGAGRPGVAEQTLLANVLVRLDERSRAAAVFESLLAGAPGSGHTRADFVAALLQWGHYERAWRVLGSAPEGEAGAAVDDGSARRLDLLRLQWLNVKGRYADARQVVESLEARYPADVDVRLARAAFDAARGRAAQAEEQYAAIRRDAPDRPDVAELVALQGRQRQPKASMQLESRDIRGAWSSTSTVASLEQRLTRDVPLTIVAERLDVKGTQLLMADGHVGAFSRGQTRFEAAITAPLAAGASLAASLFGTADGVGVGASYTRHDLRGAWKATADYGRPFWELVESAAGDGRRDRLGLQRDWRFGADASGWAVLDLNRYRLSSSAPLMGGERRAAEAAASTAALTLGFVRTVHRSSPSLALQYGMDKEHVVASTRIAAFDGRLFAPIPLVSREVHLAGVVARFPVRRLWDIEAGGGYTVDRLGGRGSFASARATALPGRRIGLDLWGERRLYSLATTQQALRGGARVTVRF
jgi:tetratricopeptide (TPR) repeat protein